MKRRSQLIVFAIVCLASVSMNILTAVNHNKAKKQIIFSIYSHLINVSKCLESLSNPALIDAPDYMLYVLDQECIQLDTLMYAANTFYTNKYSGYRFKMISEQLFRTISVYNKGSEDVLYEIAQNQEEILELIRRLSPEEKINYDEYGIIINIPNDSLSIKQVSKLINDILQTSRDN